jgi:MFS family permease
VRLLRGSDVHERHGRTIVNVVLPAIGADFAVSPSATSSVNVGYLVSLAVCIPVSGWLGDRFGTKRVFLGAFGAFVVASALCGLAADLTQLTLARMSQGAAGGMMSPVALTMLFRAYPPAQRIRLSRVLILPTAVAPALGPVLGGFFVEHLTWRWGFYVNLPIGLLALLFGALFLAEHIESREKRFDVLGFALAAPGLGLAMYALEAVSQTGLTSPHFWACGLAGFGCLAALVRTQLRAAQPMLDLRLFADPSFRRGNLILFICVAGFLGTLYGFTLLYQSGLGASAWETGLVTLPKAVGLMIASQLIGWAHRRLGPRLLIATAMFTPARTRRRCRASSGCGSSTPPGSPAFRRGRTAWRSPSSSCRRANGPCWNPTCSSTRPDAATGTRSGSSATPPATACATTSASPRSNATTGSAPPATSAAASTSRAAPNTPTASRRPCCPTGRSERARSATRSSPAARHPNRPATTPSPGADAGCGACNRGHRWGSGEHELDPGGWAL